MLRTLIALSTGKWFIVDSGIHFLNNWGLNVTWELDVLCVQEFVSLRDARQFATLETRRKLGRVCFRKDFWEWYWGRAGQPLASFFCVHSNSPRSVRQSWLGPVPFSFLKWRYGDQRSPEVRMPPPLLRNKALSASERLTTSQSWISFLRDEQLLKSQATLLREATCA